MKTERTNGLPKAESGPAPMFRATAYCLITLTTAAHAQFASDVISYVPGNGASMAYQNPDTAIGPPTRMNSDTVVSPFAPAWEPSALVTIGAGGELVLAFDAPVYDDPANPFGFDLIIFGNAFFLTADHEAPCVTGFYDEGGVIEVSADGVSFLPIENVMADDMFPTLGYRDAGPFDTENGDIETDFTMPVDPAFATSFLAGACWETIRKNYGTSGGGTGLDIGATGLAWIRFVRISTPTDVMVLPEIDAIADVSPIHNVADFNGDGVVDGADLTMLLGVWGSDNKACDVDENGIVDGADLTLVLGAWS